jgi:RecA-family ATPase
MRQQVQAEQEKWGQSSKVDTADGTIEPLSNESGVDIVKWGKTQPPSRKFIVENKIPEDTTGVLNSSGGVGKSNLLTLVAFCVAAGVSVEPFTVKKERKVFLLKVEDSELDQWRRVYALLTVYPIFHDHEQKIRENLILYPGLGKVSPFMKLEAAILLSLLPRIRR